ncbi:MAG: EAL domain-containing protein [Oscillatoriales cyanobacterium SM2_1_8]|nr:EAL domain-containing protein [Oscillatoriales cyanobacterium SM2_1_8]
MEEVGQPNLPKAGFGGRSLLNLSLNFPNCGDNRRFTHGCALPLPSLRALPEDLPEEGNLYLWFPLGHTFGKATRALQEVFADRPDDLRLESKALLAIAPLGKGGLWEALTAVLTERECASTKALWVPAGASPQFDDFPRVISLAQAMGLQSSRWLIALLDNRQLTSYFQPIVAAANPGQIVAQEALMRGLDGDGVILPGRILGAAKTAELLFQVDLAARQSAIREALRHELPQRGQKVFVNFTPSSIYDPAFCLRSTVEYVNDTGIPHEQIVFEITESERVNDMDRLRDILDFYRGAGFGVALDDIGSGYSGLNMLHRLRPDYVKLDMELIRDVDHDPYKAVVAQKIVEIAQELGITTLAEGIETAAELRWVQQAGIDLAQGFLLGKPTSPPHQAIAFAM